MNKLIYKQLHRIEKKEENFVNNKKKETLTLSITEKLEDKVPKELKEKLEYAFYKSFQLVFKKGNKIIEKTYNKEKKQLDYDICNYAFEKKENRRNLKKLNKQANKGNYINLGLTIAEGSGLGLLGVGLPDIPIFIGVLLKSIYEIALSYGYSYESTQEQYYILKLMEAALTKEKGKEINKEVDQLATFLTQNIPLDFNFDKQLQKTALTFSTELLSIKFIQGLPIIGVVGGVSNFIYCKKIIDYAKLKYQKRYLMSKLEN